MKTRHDIEVLKAGWLRDSCWDIETTPGFEAHADELQALRLATEVRWKAASDARAAAIDAEADQLGTHGLLRLLRRLEDVLRRYYAALFHLTEGRSHEAWWVLSGRQEPEDEAAEPETDGRDSRPGQRRGTCHHGRASAARGGSRRPLRWAACDPAAARRPCPGHPAAVGQWEFPTDETEEGDPRCLRCCKLEPFCSIMMLPGVRVGMYSTVTSTPRAGTYGIHTIYLQR